MTDTKLARRIEICGGIASGKTTLAALISEPNFGLAREKFHDNPFWKQFYENPQLYMAEKNICFLPQHTAPIKSWSREKLLVCDYAVFQDLAYASMCSIDGHLDVMRTIFDHLYRPLHPPALIVHLSCDPEVLLRRIYERGRKEEQSLPLEYLYSLNKAIPDFLKETLPKGTIVHQIDSEKSNFLDDEDTRRSLREEILAMVDEIF